MFIERFFLKNSFLIFLFRLWARTGLALGWLYQIVDRCSERFQNIVCSTQILGEDFLRCRLGDHIQRQIYFFGAYEPIESFLLKSMLEADDVIIDAGANIGFYTLMMAHSAPKGQVNSFEPVPSNFEILKHNISKSKRAEVIVLNNAGLWHEKSTLNFSLELDMENNIGSFTAGRVDRAVSKNQCPVLTLDDYCKDFQRLDFIKMDIEGAELSALKGGEKTIEKFRPQFLIEINRKACERFSYDPEDIAHFFKKFNYQFYLVGDIDSRSHEIDNFSNIEQANVIVFNEKRRHKVLRSWDSKKIKKYFIDLQS